MDPQQRLVLEVGYISLHSARWDRARLMGSLIGVFIGAAYLVFEEPLRSSASKLAVYCATGSGLNIISGRLSYSLGMHGPCSAIDAACAAALVACHVAASATHMSECDSSLIGGINLMLSPTISSRFALAGMTSPSGQNRTFDRRADGYVRSEACCSTVLSAGGSSNEIGPHVALRGSAVRQDGRSASLTAPNGQAQQELLAAALSNGCTVGARIAQS